LSGAQLSFGQVEQVNIRLVKPHAKMNTPSQAQLRSTKFS